MSYGNSLSKLNPCPPELVISELEKYVCRNAHILDAGCGRGELLSAIKKHGGFCACGLEPDAGYAAVASAFCNVVKAAAEDMPFKSDIFDAVIMQCVFSLCRPREAATEVVRVLRPGGVLILSDMYVESGARVNGDLVANIYSQDEIEGFFCEKFALCSFEECTKELLDMAAQAVMNGEMCASDAEMKTLVSLRPRYGFWVWKKR